MVSVPRTNVEENTMANVKDIEGIGAVFGARLEAEGIVTQEALLKAGATKHGREHIAEKCGISETQILEWVNRADLARIDGVGSEYADLLEASGVDSVPELAQRIPESLLSKLAEVNVSKRLVRSLPTLSQVTRWVEQAREIGRIVTH
jgi:predicted flap endonuclease-1-like 5' DNA nuclease